MKTTPDIIDISVHSATDPTMPIKNAIPHLSRKTVGILNPVDGALLNLSSAAPQLIFFSSNCNSFD